MSSPGILGDEKGRIKKGSADVPGAGRPRGSRPQFSEDFIHDFHKTWKKHGTHSLEAMARDRPHEFFKAAVALQPKDLKVYTNITGIVEIEYIDMTGYEDSDTLQGVLVDGEVVDYSASGRHG